MVSECSPVHKGRKGSKIQRRSHPSSKKNLWYICINSMTDLLSAADVEYLALRLILSKKMSGYRNNTRKIEILCKFIWKNIFTNPITKAKILDDILSNDDFTCMIIIQMHYRKMFIMDLLEYTQ